MALTNPDKTLLTLSTKSVNTLYLAHGEPFAPTEEIELNGNRKEETPISNF